MQRSMHYPHLIVHRCGGFHAPENSLAGLRHAARLGFKAVEFDVMLCGDGTPMLMHDDDLSRTAGDSRRLADLDTESLAALKIGRQQDPAGSGEPIPRFASAAALCLELGLWANVEIKPAQGQEQQTGQTVARMTQAFWPKAQDVVLSSFSLAALRMAQQTCPDLPRALLFEQVPEDWPTLAAQLEVCAIHTNAHHLTAPLAAKIKKAGLILACYTVNQTDAAQRLFSWGVDALFSDCPEAIPQPLHRA